jgi:hypothetical protein
VETADIWEETTQVNEGLDARTLLTVIGVLAGFFLGPFAMLEYARRRTLRTGKTDPGGAALTGPEPVESPTTRGRDADMTRSATVVMTVSTTSPAEPPLRASSLPAVRAQVVTIPGSAPKPTRSPARHRPPTGQGSRP